MDPDIPNQIEAYLRERGSWVRSQEICALFGIRERVLRALDDQPGLCSRIAISGNRGYKHVALATNAEWLDHYRRERKQAVMTLVHLRHKRRIRQNISKAILRPPVVFERDSGQVISPILAPSVEFPPAVSHRAK